MVRIAFFAVLVLSSRATAQDEFGDEFGSEFGDDSAQTSKKNEKVVPTAKEEPAQEVSASEKPEERTTSAEEARKSWEARFRLHNTILGPTGGFHVVDARPAARGSFRTQLAFGFFSKRDYLIDGDHTKSIDATLSLSWAILDFLEVFGSIANRATSNDRSDPQLLQVLGDTLLGAKGAFPVLPWLSVGGDLSLWFLNSVGDVGVMFKGTSVGLRGNATADLRNLHDAIPLIVRFNAQYMFDNSSHLVKDVEDERARSLEPPDNQVTRVERFSLGINRTDFFNLALGVEAPFEVAHDLFLSPILEWHWGIPINRQNFSCIFVPAVGTSDTPAVGEDGCLDKQGIRSFPQTFTVGARVLPPVRGLGAFFAADIGVTGKSTFVRELAPTATYQIWLGASYAYDTRKHVVEAPKAAVAAAAPGHPRGAPIHGSVVEQGSQRPIANAAIRFPGRDLTALLSGEDGRFVTYEFVPGEIALEVSHSDYQTSSCKATVPEIAPEKGTEAAPEVSVQCELVPAPRNGAIAGRVTTRDGSGVEGAKVRLTGPANRESVTDNAGRFNVDELPVGEYLVQVDSERHLLAEQRVQIDPQKTAQVEIVLQPRPKKASVEVRGREILVRRRINFALASAEILESSADLLAEIVDVFLRNPGLRLVEIQGHTDDRGKPESNMELSQQRAEAVRNWLVQHGVDSQRLEAHGYGETKPLVPNITNANRARNRRVQFIIKEQTEQ